MQFLLALRVHDKGIGEVRRSKKEDNKEISKSRNRPKKDNSMFDINIGLLTLALALNGYLAWKAAYIASQINRKTEELLLISRASLEGIAEVLKRTKTA